MKRSLIIVSFILFSLLSACSSNEKQSTTKKANASEKTIETTQEVVRVFETADGKQKLLYAAELKNSSDDVLEVTIDSISFLAEDGSIIGSIEEFQQEPILVKTKGILYVKNTVIDLSEKADVSHIHPVIEFTAKKTDEISELTLLNYEIINNKDYLNNGGEAYKVFADIANHNPSNALYGVLTVGLYDKKGTLLSVLSSSIEEEIEAYGDSVLIELSSNDYKNSETPYLGEATDFKTVLYDAVAVSQKDHLNK